MEDANETLHKNLAVIHTQLKKNDKNNWEHHVTFETTERTYKLVLEAGNPRKHQWIKGLRFDEESVLKFCYSLNESVVIWDMLSEKRFKVVYQR